MITPEATESHKISAKLLDEVRQLATTDERTLRAQLERYVRLGIQADKKG